MSNEFKSVVYEDIIYKYGADWTSYLESYEHGGEYWYQQKIMEGFTEWYKGATILEIGVGSGFTSNYCRNKGFKVTTLDIDDDKKPKFRQNEKVSKEFGNCRSR